jgi:hypothetical protein
MRPNFVDGAIRDAQKTREITRPESTEAFGDIGHRRRSRIPQLLA